MSGLQAASVARRRSTFAGASDGEVILPHGMGVLWRIGDEHLDSVSSADDRIEAHFIAGIVSKVRLWATAKMWHEGDN